MSGTLAYNMRPQSLLDILGQKHIIGENGLFTKFVEKNHPMSVILYGPPGCGKTTLAMALAHDLNMPCRTFNASTGNKKEMDLIIEEAKLSNGLFVIIDEIHRMNKMKQDNLLPYVESGLLIIVGCRPEIIRLMLDVQQLILIIQSILPFVQDVKSLKLSL